ncbi:MAG: PTS sugar transporter subunit IIC [candidate division WOR-3 bacterium]
MIGHVLALTFLGALILLDKSAFGEFGLSQPIVSCSIVGLIFGNFQIGLFLGVLLQLIWIWDLPLGSREPQDSEAAGVVAIIVFLFLKRFSITIKEEQALFVSLLLAAAAAILGQVTQKFLKHHNNRLLRYYRLATLQYNNNLPNVHKAAVSDINKIFSKAIALGVLWSFVRNFSLILFFIIITCLSITPIKNLPQFSIRDLIIIPLVISASNLLKFIVLEKNYILTILGAISGILVWALLIF